MLYEIENNKTWKIQKKFTKLKIVTFRNVKKSLRTETKKKSFETQKLKC